MNFLRIKQSNEITHLECPEQWLVFSRCLITICLLSLFSVPSPILSLPPYSLSNTTLLSDSHKKLFFEYSLAFYLVLVLVLILVLSLSLFLFLANPPQSYLKLPAGFPFHPSTRISFSKASSGNNFFKKEKKRFYVIILERERKSVGDGGAEGENFQHIPCWT